MRFTESFSDPSRHHTQGRYRGGKMKYKKGRGLWYLQKQVLTFLPFVSNKTRNHNICFKANTAGFHTTLMVDTRSLLDF